MINSQENIYTSGSFTVSISDHLPQFTIIENLLSDSLVNIDVKTLKRNNFIRHFKSVNWSVTTQNDPNFMLIINSLLDKHASFKEQAKRKEKLRLKPWISKGNLTSIKQRYKIYKEMIKAKNSQTKQLKFSLYKNYRSIIVDLLKKSK